MFHPEKNSITLAFPTFITEAQIGPEITPQNSTTKLQPKFTTIDAISHKQYLLSSEHIVAKHNINKLTYHNQKSDTTATYSTTEPPRKHNLPHHLHLKLPTLQQFCSNIGFTLLTTSSWVAPY